jgi:hypothetical protein
MKALFPYRTLFGDVNATIGEVAVDDVVVYDRIDFDQHTLSLHGINRAAWESARISLVVTAPAAEVSELDDVVCVAVANCSKSNHRIAVVLEPDPATAGRWSGELVLDRQYWYDTAEIRCGVVATVEGTSDRVVGWSEDWIIRFDDLPNRPVNGAIKITWVDFADPGENRLYLRQHTDQYVYLSIDPDEPQLFLNRGFDGLEQLLADRRRRRFDRALHDLTRASIADKTWTALFNAALDAVEVDEATSEPSWPDSDWQRTVLQALLARMYPERALDEALRDAWTTRHTPDSPGTLQQLLAPAASTQARAPRLLRDGIRVIANELEAEDEEMEA